MLERNAPKLLESLLDEIELRCNPEIGSEEARNFRIGCLSIIAGSMADICVEALNALKRRSCGGVSDEDLAALSTRCLDAIEDEESTAPFGAILAVGEALYAELHPHERNFSEYHRSFVDSINGVDPHYEQCIQLLQQHFPNCLS